MGQRVQLPPGCAGFTCADGSRYSAEAGTSVVLEDHHARSLSKSQHSEIGLVKASEGFSLGTKRGRRCVSCARLWQAWSLECPRCGSPTSEEGPRIEEFAASGENEATGRESDASAASTGSNLSIAGRNS
jgi:hypothetical protein